MLHFGKHSAFPKLLFIKNRLKIESAIMQGLQEFSPAGSRALSPIISRRRHDHNKEEVSDPMVERLDHNFPERRPSYKGESHYAEVSGASYSADSSRTGSPPHSRRASLMDEVRRQSAVLFGNTAMYDNDAE